MLGPNGAGKSTLIGIVSSLVDKTSGDVRIFDVDLSADRDAAMRLIGLVRGRINSTCSEKPLDILVNYASFYHLPHADAARRRGAQARAAWRKANRMSHVVAASTGCAGDDKRATPADPR